MPTEDSLLKKLIKIAEEVEKTNPSYAAVVRRPDGKVTMTFGKPRNG